MNTKNAPERITFASGWYIEYPQGFCKGDLREGEYWLFNQSGIGKMIVGFDEDDALEFAAAMQPSLQPQVSEGVVSFRVLNDAQAAINGQYGNGSVISMAEWIIDVSKRQPATVSADVSRAIERLQQFVTKYGAELEECDLSTLRSHTADLSAKLAEAERMLEEMSRSLDELLNITTDEEFGDLEERLEELFNREDIIKDATQVLATYKLKRRANQSAYKKGSAR